MTIEGETERRRGRSRRGKSVNRDEMEWLVGWLVAVMKSCVQS